MKFGISKGARRLKQFRAKAFADLFVNFMVNSRFQRIS